jgi:AraC family transcriptional regulator, activator of mtrCDE
MQTKETDERSLDTLSQLAPFLHVHQVRYESGVPWAVGGRVDESGADGHEISHPPAVEYCDSPDVLVQLVQCGACDLDLVELQHCVQLSEGDIAILPHGSRHVVREHGASHATEIQLIGGRFALEHARENFVLAALPDLMIVRACDGAEALRLRRVVAAIAEELMPGRAGGGAIANELASALLMMIVRIHLDREGALAGLLRVLCHRRAARPVLAMLNAPGHAWTLDELAQLASSSRASLVRTFQKAVCMAPLEFLAELRLSLARRRLVATTLPLAQIAAEIGYRSESSFSRAFRRRFGMPPGEARLEALPRKNDKATTLLSPADPA